MPANALANGMRRVGAGTIRAISRAGFAARFFGAVLLHSPSAFRRLQLTAREIYFSGVLSLVVIMVSGLFVGMVLGLQGYDALNKYGAGDSLGIFVGLSLVRELGPVVAGLLFASRAGSAVTAEIGLMKTTEQLSAMEMMAVALLLDGNHLALFGQYRDELAEVGADGGAAAGDKEQRRLAGHRTAVDLVVHAKPVVVRVAVGEVHTAS